MADVSEKDVGPKHEELEHGGSELSSPHPMDEEPVVTAKTWVVVFVSCPSMH
jgi:hypothetical protein